MLDKQPSQEGWEEGKKLPLQLQLREEMTAIDYSRCPRSECVHVRVCALQEAMTNPDSVLKSRDITLLTKV